MKQRIRAPPGAATAANGRAQRLWQKDSKETGADRHPHALRFSTYAGFDATEEMSPATANQAALQRASHAWIEYEAHTSAMHPRKRPNGFYPSSSNLQVAGQVAYHL